MHSRGALEGWAALAAFIVTIPLANWMVGHVGTICPPGQPCLVPVAPGVMAPSGVVMIGLALVLRDLVQRRLGILAGLGAIAVGGAVSATVAPASLALASTAAFLLSETADLLVYTPLQRRRFVTAVLLSGMIGLLVDSAVFLQLAFGNLDYLAGQALGKLWMVLAATPFLVWLRRRDERIGLAPA